MTPAEAFAITAEERDRFDAAPFRGTDEDGWRAFASQVHEQVLKSYAEGEINLERALQAVRSCSLGCRLADRVFLMALTAELALRITPVRRKHPPNPTWVRQSAALLVSMLREDRPGEPVAPNEMNGWTTLILSDAIAWLVALDLCEPIDPRTLYSWYLARTDAQSVSTSTA